LPRLTRSHRQVADYVLEHPLQVATLPIDELAAAVGVSVATANRFARALDFDGYATFRAELVRGFESLVAPVERLRGNLEHPTTVAEVFATALDESRRNIEATRQTLDYAACEAAVERIGKARSIYIGGFGASAWLAGLLQHGLDGSCNDVRMLSSVSGVTHAARTLMHAGPQDLFIGLTFPRYLTDTVALAQIARGQGCAVLALTDRPELAHGAAGRRGALLPDRDQLPPELRDQRARADRGADQRGGAARPRAVQSAEPHPAGRAALAARRQRAAAHRGNRLCAPAPTPDTPTQTARCVRPDGAQEKEESFPMKNNSHVPVIAIHGGAGTISAATTSADAGAGLPRRAAEHRARRAGDAAEGRSALDATCLAVELLEECPLFNAGHGAVFTHDETHELDAAVMDGATLAAGAIAGVCHVRRPVRAARAVLEDGAHVLLAGAGAEAFAREHGLEMVEPFFFSTDARRQQLYRVRDTGRVVTDHEGRDGRDHAAARRRQEVRHRRRRRARHARPPGRRHLHRRHDQQARRPHRRFAADRRRHLCRRPHGRHLLHRQRRNVHPRGGRLRHLRAHGLRRRHARAATHAVVHGSRCPPSAAPAG
jgi:DNA-binding MurR/RpiR family transcriptional regulator